MPQKRRTTRRQFLTGRSAVEAVGDLTHGEVESSPNAARQGRSSPGRERAAGAKSGGYLLQVGRRAMACDFQIYLNAGQHRGAPEWALEALDLIEQLEDQMTIYRPHSEVSRINRAAAEEPMLVERRLFYLLEQARQIHAATDGAFDITSTPLSKVWGFSRREGRFPSQEEIDAALQLVGGRHVQLNAQEQTIRFLKPGVAINLGGIGKGHALDRCAELFAAAEADDVLIHGGLSSVLARGSRQGRTGWPVALGHPLKQGVRLAEIYLQDRALGTSGNANQFFHHRGKRYGHVLDPRTGWPTEGVLSATVLAPTAAEADALATAFYVLGVEKAFEICRRRDDLAALIVTPGKRTGAIEIHSHHLDDADWKLLV